MLENTKRIFTSGGKLRPGSTSEVGASMDCVACDKSVQTSTGRNYYAEPGPGKRLTKRRKGSVESTMKKTVDEQVLDKNVKF